jgi:hypothetical protein
MPHFADGNPGGPGRPKGCRNKSTLLLDALGAEGIEDVIALVQQKAKDGNLQAAQILLDRLWPRGPRLQPLGLPLVKTAADVVEANAVLIERISEGEVAPEQANAASTVIENQRRGIETRELEQRLQELEAATAHIRDPKTRPA